MMKSSHRRLAILALLLLVIGMGAFVARRNRAEPPEPTIPPVGAKLEERPGETAGVPPRLVEGERLREIVATKGPDAALEAAMALGDDSQVLSLLMTLARTDPAWVASVLKDSGLGETHRGFVTDSILQHWQDGEAAVAWVENELTGKLRKMALGKALGILVGEDADAAVAHLEQLPPSDTRRQVIVDLFSAWGAADPLAALARAGSMDEQESNPATRAALRSWFRQDAAAAAAWVAGREEPSATMIAAIASGWEEGPALDAWLATLPEGAEKEAALARVREQVVLRGCGVGFAEPPPDTAWKTKPVAEMSDVDLRNWAYQDPAGARAFIEETEYDAGRQHLVITAAVQVAHGDGGPQAAWDWGLELPEGAAEVALGVALTAWMGKEPEVAAARVAELPAERRGDLVKRVTESWSGHDPAAAAAWVASWEGGEQPAMVRAVVQEWGKLDPNAAYHWLGSLPAGASRDEGISYLLRRERDAAPEVLDEWVGMISDPQLRARKRSEVERR